MINYELFAIVERNQSYEFPLNNVAGIFTPINMNINKWLNETRK